MSIESLTEGIVGRRSAPPDDDDEVSQSTLEALAMNDEILVGSVADLAEAEEEPSRGCCRRKRPFNCRVFCRKYFWEGQNLHSDHAEKKAQLPPDAPLYKKIFVRYRHVIAPAIPATIWWTFLFGTFAKQNLWHIWREKYFMTLTMILGSLVAGATCEGGGAVAFPVMTLAFKIHPSIARDFAIMVQAAGMTSGSFCILFMKVKIETRAVVFVSIGSFVGILIGFEFVDPYLTPSQKKIGFVCLFFAFAFALFLLNLDHKRRVFLKIPEFKLWKALVLIATGFVGGIFTAIGGTGTDLCCFSILTLLFRVSEKTATPTSVLIMAINSNVGFVWRGMVNQLITPDAYQFILCAMPVVCIGTPTGTVIGTHVHRLVLACFVYILDTTAFITAFIIIPMNTVLWIEAASILVVGFSFFFAISRVGRRLLANYDKREKLELEEKRALSLEEDYQFGKEVNSNHVV